jgi:hypothetical protein
LLAPSFNFLFLLADAGGYDDDEEVVVAVVVDDDGDVEDTDDEDNNNDGDARSWCPSAVHFLMVIADSSHQFELHKIAAYCLEMQLFH